MVKKLVKFLLALYFKIRFITKCRIHAFSNVILGRSFFEGKNSLGKKTYFCNTFLGFASYIGHSGEFSNCRIGRFCSIGSNVRVVSAFHPTSSLVSSHPAFYSNSFYFTFTKQTGFSEHIKTSTGYECEIGNDVWIGDNVLIKGGVKIGNGAIIGMGSVVTHDVLPFTIVAGVPARLIRKRFEDDIISKLLVIEWWNKPLRWIIEHSNEFMNPNEFVRLHYINDKVGIIDGKNEIIHKKE